MHFVSLKKKLNLAFFILIYLLMAQQRQVYISNQLIIQKTADLYVDGKGVIDLVG